MDAYIWWREVEHKLVVAGSNAKRYGDLATWQKMTDALDELDELRYAMNMGR